MRNFKKIVCYAVACLFFSVTFVSTAQAGIDVDALVGSAVGGLLGGGGGSDSGGQVFDTLATRTGNFAQGFRSFAMVLSGFGIIMFTFLAICGKINFKHLGYIFICLFFLSGVGALIVYIADVPEGLVFAGDFNKASDTVDKAVNSEGNLGHSSSL